VSHGIALPYSVMGNRAEEEVVFGGFLNAAPRFAEADVKKWIQPKNDPPDIQVELANGRNVAIELTSWLHESQIGREKKVEFVELSFREAIQPEPPNQTVHIFLVWMAPKCRMALGDKLAFKTELLALTEEIDQRWESEPAWQSPQGFLWVDFTCYPTLAKYLESVDIHPRMPSVASTMRKGGRYWLTFPPRGGGYSPDWMVDALREVVPAKIAKYAEKPIGSDEFHLLVHYDKAFVYNTPVRGINFGYAEAVQVAAARIGSSVGMFDKIFVYVPVTEGQKVFRLYPPE
jgi:hypothetical protein